MKKILFLLAVALVFTLSSCTEPKDENVEKDNPKENIIEQNQENQNETPENVSTEDELPWISEPIETPIIPPMFRDETEDNTSSEDTTDNTTTQPSDTQSSSNENNTSADIGFVLDENETPPIPIN